MFSQELNTNGTVLEDPEAGSVIQMQAPARYLSIVFNRSLHLGELEW
jgi:hypothetical protein